MPDFAPLPAEVLEICRSVYASPRLVAHLTIVHDVAAKLLDHLHRAFPELHLDRDAVLFGAAVHDIGKAIHADELSGPGSQHERQGFELLKKLGVSEERARFTFTHAAWEGRPLEDLVVALADKCWKGKRVSLLEEETARKIGEQLGKEHWETFAALDEILEQLAEQADARLAWQAEFPTASTE